MLESDPSLPSAAAPVVPPAVPHWSPDSIFNALGTQLRRQMFLAIARAPAGLSIVQVAARLRRKPSATGKQLRLLRRGGFVVEQPVAGDGKAFVHVLHPALRPPQGEPLVLDFGFMQWRL